jgi:hypothetical protein
MVDFVDSDVFQNFAVAMRTRVESGAENHQLRRATVDRADHQLVDATRAHQHQPGKAEDLRIGHRVVEVAAGRGADRMVGDERQFLGTDQPIRKPIRIAHAGVRFARPQCASGGGQDSGA